MKLSWQPLRIEDTAAVQTLFRSVSTPDLAEELPSTDDISATLVGFEPSVRAGGWLENKLVAYAALIKRDGTEKTRELSLTVVVDPIWQTPDIAQSLKGWLSQTIVHLRSQIQVQGRLKTYASVRDSEAWTIRFLESAGFLPERVFGDLRASLQGRAPYDFIVKGYSLTRFSAELSEEVRLACNEAFANHWGTTAWSPQSWRSDITDVQEFLPDKSFALLEDSSAQPRVVAFILSSAAQRNSHGSLCRQLYIDLVGTRTSARGGGLASSLLAYALSVAAGAGYDEAALTVDSKGESNALRLYERLGFEITDKSTSWLLEGEPVM